MIFLIFCIKFQEIYIFVLVKILENKSQRKITHNKKILVKSSDFGKITAILKLKN